MKLRGIDAAGGDDAVNSRDCDRTHRPNRLLCYSIPRIPWLGFAKYSLPSGRKYHTMPFYWFVLGALAVWRITHLFHAEDGPWDVLITFRRTLGAGTAGAILDCFYCLSVWVSAPIAYAIGSSWRERLLLWPALSGAAILLERFSSATRQPVAPLYYEEQEHDNVLRTEARGDHADVHDSTKT